MKRLLFTSGPGAGHVLPMLPLAKTEIEAGHAREVNAENAGRPSPADVAVRLAQR